jgi:hypothetical protein
MHLHLQYFLTNDNYHLKLKLDRECRVVPFLLVEMKTRQTEKKEISFLFQQKTLVGMRVGFDHNAIFLKGTSNK